MRGKNLNWSFLYYRYTAKHCHGQHVNSSHVSHPHFPHLVFHLNVPDPSSGVPALDIIGLIGVFDESTCE